MESSILSRVIHSAANKGIKFKVTEVADGLLAIKTLPLGFTNHFTSHVHADFPDSVKFRIQPASIDLVGVDCRAESYR